MKTRRQKLKITAIVLASIVGLVAFACINYYAIIGATYFRDELAPSLIRKEIPQDTLHALETATSVETSLVDPDKLQAPGAILTLAEVATSTITDPADIRRLSVFLKEGAERARLPALGFAPRHTIRFGDGEDSHYLLIDFESNQLRIMSGATSQSTSRLPFTGNFESVADLFPSVPSSSAAPPENAVP